MRFHSTQIEGVVLVDLVPHEDDRGFFGHAYNSEVFAQSGLMDRVDACYLSLSRRAGTIRGLHYQTSPNPQIKLIRCVRGRVFDVAVDVRPSSKTYLKQVAVELTAENRRAIYVPAGVAQGWQALTDDAEIMYLVNGPYSPSDERGLRWDDPALGIPWPLSANVVSDKDRSWALHTAEAPE